VILLGVGIPDVDYSVGCDAMNTTVRNPSSLYFKLRDNHAMNSWKCFFAVKLSTLVVPGGQSHPLLRPPPTSTSRPGRSTTLVLSCFAYPCYCVITFDHRPTVLGCLLWPGRRYPHYRWYFRHYWLERFVCSVSRVRTMPDDSLRSFVLGYRYSGRNWADSCVGAQQDRAEHGSE
jgi:hypothetical protein